MSVLRASLFLSSVLVLSACGQSDGASVSTPSEISSVQSVVTPDLAGRFSKLALECVHREYPNKIGHTMSSDADAGTPRQLHPAFYGCFDWHSSVHGHWLLVRLLHVGPQDAPWRAEAIAKLSESFTPENIAGEMAYFENSDRGSYERPYGVAWLLQLTAELREWDDAQAKEWLATLEPLEQMIAGRLKNWMPKLAYPIRLGTHNQSAFAFGLMLDWARVSGDTDMEALIVSRSKDYHLADKACPLAYEPSGEDFLSPCLMEADLMRRVLDEREFARWLTGFLPDLPTDGSGDWLAPGIVKDASDGKLVHLDGVNLSRAWNLENIAASLPDGDPRIGALNASAAVHREAGLKAVTDAHYSGSHWLASFATYLMTKRGQ
ncbi:MAG: hypothetical protein COA69_13740 [Robiginitomaculum sp.]|nr:MAG: hypothetical protein COA69_13740 [Robiginitomaculum sp.]